jgi:hypothetical protein
VASTALAASRRSQSDEPKREAAFPAEIPAGPLQIIVSIRNQRATLYSDGNPVVSTPVSTGVPDHPTPRGVFSILQKRTWHESNIYSAAPMPFMQRITWSGVALHEGVVPGHPASHGCIRLPHDFANWLFGITDLGVRVVVADDDPKAEEISHPFLFAAKAGASAERAAQETGSIYRASASVQPPRKLASLDADAGVEQDAARINTVSVFISRKEGRLFVRRNFAPLFDAPVKIEDRQRPLGTHIFTAMGFKDGGPDMRWSVISMKSGELNGELHDRYSVKERWVNGRPVKTAWYSREQWTPQSASEVLDRIEIPREIADRISEMLTPGSSLIVSDEGLNKETRKHTDFVVLTAPGQFVSADPDEQERREREDKRRPSRQERAAHTQPVTSVLPARTELDSGAAPMDRSQAPPPVPAPAAALQVPAASTPLNEPAPRQTQSAPELSPKLKASSGQNQPDGRNDSRDIERLTSAPPVESAKASRANARPQSADEEPESNARERRAKRHASRDEDRDSGERRSSARIIELDREPRSRTRREAEDDVREPTSRERVIERVSSRSRRESAEPDARPQRRAAANGRAGAHQIDLLPP